MAEARSPKTCDYLLEWWDGGTQSLAWPNADEKPDSPVDISDSGWVRFGASLYRYRGGVAEVPARVRVEVYEGRVWGHLIGVTESDQQMVSGFECETGTRFDARVFGLEQNQQYFVRFFVRWEDTGADLEWQFRQSFYVHTNKPPNPPELLKPEEGSQQVAAGITTLTWDFSDPNDPEDTLEGEEVPQAAYEVRYQPVGAEEWVRVRGSTPEEHSIPGGTLSGGESYRWQVRVQDPQGLWSNWSNSRTFYVLGNTRAPDNLEPWGQPLIVTEESSFTWRFRTNIPATQAGADLRYRPTGQSAWVTVTHDGDTAERTFLPGTFTAGQTYEWQVRTTDDDGRESAWSLSAYFYAVEEPGAAAITPPLPETVDIQGSLGCGTYRVFVYDRGGVVQRGEITPIASLRWSRVRDDISDCTIRTAGFGEDCCELFEQMRSWMHEIVVFRDGERVWEGPITRIGLHADEVEINARDVMIYVYRRILRNGYNDSYPNLKTVIERAHRNIVGGLAPNDPNVLPYLTRIDYPDDAQESRIVQPWSRTCWEDVDDMAATAGLDYVTVGRRIILWDTHRPIGILPEMRDENFSDAVSVTEYGMQTANLFGVTNNNGVWGSVVVTDDEGVPRREQYYGRVEMLASAYDEAEAGEATTLTPSQEDALEEALTGQAARNIAGRWPTPLVVRVPDNSTVTPDTNISINHLIPGAWIPLRATQTCRKMSQVQKLDSVRVVVENGDERINVVMSPAPGASSTPEDDMTGGPL